MAGGFRVQWHEELDMHILYRDGQRIAGHHNGFSCHCLAQRILGGDLERALAQFDYIKACGGRHYISRDAVTI
jgi:hypothetical protein